MSASTDRIDYSHPDAHEALPLDLLKDAAELRAAGHDWAEVGAELGRNAVHLRLACRRDPRFELELDAAHRAVLREAEAEVLRKLRARLRDTDVAASVRAAECLAKYLTARRTSEARVQVEEIKMDAKLGAEQMKVEAKCAPRDPRPEDSSPTRESECEQLRTIGKTLREIRMFRRQVADEQGRVTRHADARESREQPGSATGRAG